MISFDMNQIKVLKEYLYENFYSHDSEIELEEYNRTEDNFKIKMNNPHYGKNMVLILEKVKAFLSMRGNWFLGNRKEVLALTVEEDHSCFQLYKDMSGECIEKYLHLCFQMFSGDEIHIVCEKVLIEVEDREKVL